MEKAQDINKEALAQELNAFLEKHASDSSMCAVFGLVMDKDGNCEYFKRIQKNKKSYISPWCIMDAIGPLECELENKMFAEIYESNPDIRREDCELQLDAYRNLVRKWYA